MKNTRKFSLVKFIDFFCNNLLFNLARKQIRSWILNEIDDEKEKLVGSCIWNKSWIPKRIKLLNCSDIRIARKLIVFLSGIWTLSSFRNWHYLDMREPIWFLLFSFFFFFFFIFFDNFKSYWNLYDICHIWNSVIEKLFIKIKILSPNKKEIFRI